MLGGTVVDVQVDGDSAADLAAGRTAIQALAGLGACAALNRRDGRSVGRTCRAEGVATGPCARLTPTPQDWSMLAGLPTGTAPFAGGLALAAAGLLAHLSGADVRVDPEAVTAHLLLPLVVAEATDTEVAAAPPPPTPTVDGYVCADLGAEGDREAFERLLKLLPPEQRRPEELAVCAQEWRLPVTPYRRRPKPPGGAPPLGLTGPHTSPGPHILTGSPRPTGMPWHTGMPWQMGTPWQAGTASQTGMTAAGRVARAADRDQPLSGVTVVDLTIMWSGPLCTSILGALGARVLKVEPDCRRDGTRFSPSGRLFEALNRDKVRVPLDLRELDQRAELLDLVAQADLVVDNFAPRVAPNLGIDAATLHGVNPGVGVLSLPAFPPGPERDWVSYGTGIHAWSGLGDLGEDGFAAPAVTYPDPLTGLAGLLAGLALLTAAGAGSSRLRAEVPLATVVAPLLEVPELGSLPRPVDGVLTRRLAQQFGAVPPPPLRVAEAARRG